MASDLVAVRVSFETGMPPAVAQISSASWERGLQLGPPGATAGGVTSSRSAPAPGWTIQSQHRPALWLQSRGVGDGEEHYFIKEKVGPDSGAGGETPVERGGAGGALLLGAVRLLLN